MNRGDASTWKNVSVLSPQRNKHKLVAVEAETQALDLPDDLQTAGIVETGAGDRKLAFL